MARAFRDGYPYGAPVEKTLHHHAALGKRVVLRQPPADRYAAGGAFELVNGARGSAYHHDGFWLGFEEVDFEALLDLGDILPVRSISCGFLQNYNRWIFLPTELEFAVSTDGDEFRVVGTQTPDVSPDILQEFTQDVSVELEAFVTRYIRIHARNRGTCPPGHPGAGGKAWLFVDEIQVR
jgi:hexosaminidase